MHVSDRQIKEGQRCCTSNHLTDSSRAAPRTVLLYADIRPVQDSERDTLPHVHLTDDTEWDPRVPDHEVDAN